MKTDLKSWRLIGCLARLRLPGVNRPCFSSSMWLLLACRLADDLWLRRRRSSLRMSQLPGSSKVKLWPRRKSGRQTRAAGAGAGGQPEVIRQQPGVRLRPGGTNFLPDLEHIAPSILVHLLKWHSQGQGEVISFYWMRWGFQHFCR